MTKQLHKRFSTKEVKIFLKKYLTENVKLMYILEILQITQGQFFRLLKAYRKNPDGLSIEYKRTRASRRIKERIEKNIIGELTMAKRLIEDKDIAVVFYNYSYIKDQLEDKYQQSVSLSTIIESSQPSASASLFSMIPPTTSSLPMPSQSLFLTL